MSLMPRPFITWTAHRAVPFGPWATLARTLMTRTVIRSAFFLTSHHKTRVEEHLGSRAICLGDVRCIRAFISCTHFHPLDRRVGVLRRNRSFDLRRGITSERLFGRVVHVTTTRSAGMVWRLSVFVGVLTLLRLCRGSRSSGVVNS